jgi:hypothetical protein
MIDTRSLTPKIITKALYTYTFIYRYILMCVHKNSIYILCKNITKTNRKQRTMQNCKHKHTTIMFYSDWFNLLFTLLIVSHYNRRRTTVVTILFRTFNHRALPSRDISQFIRTPHRHLITFVHHSRNPLMICARRAHSQNSSPLSYRRRVYRHSSSRFPELRRIRRRRWRGQILVYFDRYFYVFSRTCSMSHAY